MQYQNIPAELRSYNQWVVWRYEERQADKPTKVPYDCKTGYMAAVDDASTWSTFDQVVQAVGFGYDGIGFVLHEHDPFCFIDLDGTKDDASLQRQIKIFKDFDSYSERSPSGNGCHIIVKGHVPKGRKRSNIEVYSSLRYMTMTGDVIADKPIRERQDLVTILWSEMGRDSSGNQLMIDTPQTVDDNTIINRALNAANGHKFHVLCSGQWADIYPTQSEADLAFIDMLAFYTQNREQIARIFRASPLGQRDKARRVNYVEGMITKSFDRMVPPLDLSQITAALAARPNTKTNPPPSGGQPGSGAGVVFATTVPSGMNVAPAPPPVKMPKGTTYTVPPGLMGDIVQFIYASAPRQVPETALVAAIGLMAGICGRSYNTYTGAGLNLYTLLIMRSGRGKEAISSGISKLVSAVSRLTPNGAGGQQATPAIANFIGPSEIRSDVALLKHLVQKPSMVSIIGEFGVKLQAMTSAHANANLMGLKAVWLDLYGKSGADNRLGETIYSDKDKNSASLTSPAFSLIAESTPSTFYEALSETLIQQGLLPRFLTIEYFGDRPPMNKGLMQAQPSNELVHRLGSLAAISHQLMHNGRVMTVPFHPEAEALADAYDTRIDAIINNTDSDAFNDLWSRAHLKAMKLASLVAVGINAHAPMVTPDVWQWAESLVTRDIQNLLGKFERGEIGRDSEGTKQTVEVMRVVNQCLTDSWDNVEPYVKQLGPVGYTLHSNNIVPYIYIQRRLASLAAFRLDRIGATNAINKTIDTLIASGQLIELGERQLQQFGAHMGRRGMLRAFVPSGAAAFEN